jgi:pimeloyl-ACP methyl ester carboxylesterase
VDGDFPAWNMRPHAYRDLARQLAEHGIVSLRFAKVGPGTGSEIVDSDAWSRAPNTFEQRLIIAAAFLDRLRREHPRLPIFLLGHSEGALVATLMAQNHIGLSGIALLSGPAKPLMRLVAEQQFQTDLQMGAVTPEKERHYKEMDSLLESFVADRELPAGASANPYASMLTSMMHPGAIPYMRSLESIDPAAELRKVSLPVLIVQGGKDTSVFPENAGLLARSQPRAQVERFENLQHFYKTVPEGLPATEHFGLATESDPAVANTIAAWIDGHANSVTK